MRKPESLLTGLAAAFLLLACSSGTSGGGGTCTTNADCPGKAICNNSRCQAPVAAADAGPGAGTSGASSSGTASSSERTGSSSGASSSSPSASTAAGSSSGGSSSSPASSSSSGGGTSSACPTACNAPFSCDAASGLCKNQGVPQLTSFWIIVMENTSFSLLTPSAAPYLNSLFSADGGPGVELVRYQDIGVHPSTPNYIALTGGDNFGISGSDYAADQAAGQVAATHPDIATQLEDAGLTWHEYSEAQLTPCAVADTGSDGTPPGSFASKHDPMPHFLITQGTPSCTANDVSYEAETGMPGIAADIAAGTFFNYVFISPNLCDDGHDLCGPQFNQITQQDDWLKANVPLILNSSAYANNGFLFITWDEGSLDTDAIMAVAISPMLANPGTQDAHNYTHFSLLSTVEAGFGLSSLPQANGHNDPLITTIWK